MYVQYNNQRELFLIPGGTFGYCGAEFHCDPPKNSLHAMTDRLDSTGAKRERFFECRGVPQISLSHFL